MILTAMRTKFSAGANDLDAELDSSAIDAYLNRAYRYAIPNDIGGEFSKVFWTLTTTASTSDYDPPVHIFGAGNELSAWMTISSQHYFLSVETDPARWEWQRGGNTTFSGRPRSVLFYGSDLARLWPVPDDEYTITIPCRGGPSSDLDSTGLTDDRHALSVIYSALMEYHDETQDEVSRAKAEREYERWKKRLRVTAHARPNKRHQARSF